MENNFKFPKLDDDLNIDSEINEAKVKEPKSLDKAVDIAVKENTQQGFKTLSTTIECACVNIYKQAYYRTPAFDVYSKLYKGVLTITCEFEITDKSFSGRWFKSELNKLFSNVKITSYKYTSNWGYSSSQQYEFKIEKQIEADEDEEMTDQELGEALFAALNESKLFNKKLILQEDTLTEFGTNAKIKDEGKAVIIIEDGQGKRYPNDDSTFQNLKAARDAAKSASMGIDTPLEIIGMVGQHEFILGEVYRGNIDDKKQNIATFKDAIKTNKDANVKTTTYKQDYMQKSEEDRVTAANNKKRLETINELLNNNIMVKDKDAYKVSDEFKNYIEKSTEIEQAVKQEILQELSTFISDQSKLTIENSNLSQQINKFNEVNEQNANNKRNAENRKLYDGLVMYAVKKDLLTKATDKTDTLTLKDANIETNMDFDEIELLQKLLEYNGNTNYLDLKQDLVKLINKYSNQSATISQNKDQSDSRNTENANNSDNKNEQTSQLPDNDKNNNKQQEKEQRLQKNKEVKQQMLNYLLDKGLIEKQDDGHYRLTNTANHLFSKLGAQTNLTKLVNCTDNNAKKSWDDLKQQIDNFTEDDINVARAKGNDLPAKIINANKDINNAVDAFNKVKNKQGKVDKNAEGYDQYEAAERSVKDALEFGNMNQAGAFIKAVAPIVKK